MSHWCCACRYIYIYLLLTLTRFFFLTQQQTLSFSLSLYQLTHSLTHSLTDIHTRLVAADTMPVIEESRADVTVQVEQQHVPTPRTVTPITMPQIQDDGTFRCVVVG